MLTLSFCFLISLFGAQCAHEENLDAMKEKNYAAAFTPMASLLGQAGNAGCLVLFYQMGPGDIAVKKTNAVSRTVCTMF